MRTAAWETAPRIALRDYSRGRGGRSIYQYVILLKGELKHFFYRRFSASSEELRAP